MLQMQRQNQILLLLHQQGFLSTKEIANLFNVSQMTVWRDITQLESHGLIKRVRGGVALPDWSLGEDASIYVTSDMEKHVYEFPPGIKDPRRIALGKYVAKEIIRAGDDLILEGGSTVASVIPFIDAENITIITNGLNTMALTQVYDTVQTVLCCGGVLNQPNAIFIGPQAENFFMSYRVDYALVGAAGLNLKDGFVDPSPIYDSMKRVMCRSARKRIVMLDSSKIGKPGLSKVMGIGEVDILVTNVDADPQIISVLQEKGLDVRLASI